MKDKGNGAFGEPGKKRDAADIPP